MVYPNCSFIGYKIISSPDYMCPMYISFKFSFQHCFHFNVSQIETRFLVLLHLPVSNREVLVVPRSGREGHLLGKAEVSMGQNDPSKFTPVLDLDFGLRLGMQS